jgi:hypothetical protein
VSLVALVAVGSGTHFGEKSCSVFLAKLVEEHRRHAALAVAEKPAIGHGKPVLPRTDGALAFGRLQRDPAQAGQHRVVTGRHRGL